MEALRSFINNLTCIMVRLNFENMQVCLEDYKSERTYSFLILFFLYKLLSSFLFHFFLS